jgi:hypothetical protein
MLYEKLCKKNSRKKFHKNFCTENTARKIQERTPQKHHTVPSTFPPKPLFHPTFSTHFKASQILTVLYRPFLALAPFRV